MNRHKKLLAALEQLRASHGASAFRDAVRILNRERLHGKEREPRKKFSWSMYRKLYHLQNGICPLCSGVMPFLKGKVEIDHRDPNRHDFNSVQNLQLTHRDCNRRKSSKSI